MPWKVDQLHIRIQEKSLGATQRRSERQRNLEAVISFCLGQYIWHDVADDLCRWLTACLQNGMTHAQLKSVVNKITQCEEVVKAFGMEWEEYLCQYASNFSDLPEFYLEAVASKADRFVPHYNRSEEATHLVALRGDASQRAIKACVIRTERSTDKKDRAKGDR